MRKYYLHFKQPIHRPGYEPVVRPSWEVVRGTCKESIKAEFERCNPGCIVTKILNSNN